MTRTIKTPNKKGTTPKKSGNSNTAKPPRKSNGEKLVAIVQSKPLRNIENKWYEQTFSELDSTISIEERKALVQGLENKVMEAIDRVIELEGNNPVVCLPSYLMMLFGNSNYPLSEAEQMGRSIRKLISFFTRPEISKAFGDQQDLQETITDLNRIIDFVAYIHNPESGVPHLLEREAIALNFEDMGFGILKLQLDYYTKKAQVLEYERSLEEEENK